MIKNDFSEKIAEEFVISLEEIMKNKSPYNIRMDLIEECYRKYLGFNYTLINNLTCSDLVKLLKHTRLNDYTRITLLGFLVKEEAVIIENCKNKDPYLKYLRAFELLTQYILLNGFSFIKNQEETIEYVISMLLGYNLDTSVMEKILYVNEALGNFGKAEDICYDILEKNKTFKSNLISFYKRLLEKNDDELEKGNLSKTEVLEALKTLV